MTISAENLALLPTDGQLEVTVIQVPEDPEENDEDLGPAAAQRDSEFLKGRPWRSSLRLYLRHCAANIPLHRNPQTRNFTIAFPLRTRAR